MKPAIEAALRSLPMWQTPANPPTPEDLECQAAEIAVALRAIADSPEAMHAIYPGFTSGTMTEFALRLADFADALSHEEQQR